MWSQKMFFENLYKHLVIYRYLRDKTIKVGGRGKEVEERFKYQPPPPVDLMLSNVLHKMSKFEKKSLLYHKYLIKCTKY